jgi:hypothetical protein
MIEIICDQYELYPDQDFDSIVTESAQYEEELSKIEAHAEQSASFRIVVRNPALFDWFDAAVKYGAKKHIVTPVKELARQLRCQVIPDWLEQNQRWIGELGLIEKSKDVSETGVPVATWLKQTLLGVPWTKREPILTDDLSDIVNLLGCCDENTVHPLKRYLINECLLSWSQLRFDFSELFEWLKENPFERSKYIVWEQLLSKFPEDKKSTWLQQKKIWFELSSFPNRHKLPRLNTSIKIPEFIVAFARSFLDQEWEKSPGESLSFVSGFLDFEKNFLLQKLRYWLNSEKPINDSLYKEIMQFKQFPDILEIADHLRPKKPPPNLSSDSSFNEIQAWINNDYLPFYNSCSLLGMIDETTPYVQMFEKWLEHHYTELLFGDGMAYQQLAQIKDYVTTGEPVLMIVFDGLDYLCARDDLLPVMLDNGLYPSNDILPYLSFLPTQTYIAKPSLVGGRLKSQLPDEISTAQYYEQLLTEFIGISKNNIRSRSERDATLLELIQEPANVYLYLDNHLDQELLHRNYRQHLRQKKYKEYVKKQGEEIARCQADFQDLYGKSLKIVVTSDHGYTIIPKNTGVIDIPLKKMDKTRTVIDIDLKDISDMDLENIWTLNPDLFGLNTKMSIPKGYYCFGKKPLGATHGGCTPQEMAVPWFVFSDTKPGQAKQLSFSIEGEIFRKRTDNSLIMKISNTNPYQISITQFEIVGLATPFNIPLMVSGNSIYEVDFQFDASSIVENYVNFAIMYCFNGPAGSMKSEVMITVPTTGAMTTEFDNDFDF